MFTSDLSLEKAFFWNSKISRRPSLLEGIILKVRRVLEIKTRQHLFLYISIHSTVSMNKITYCTIVFNYVNKYGKMIYYIYQLCKILFSV